MSKVPFQQLNYENINNLHICVCSTKFTIQSSFLLPWPLLPHFHHPFLPPHLPLATSLSCSVRLVELITLFGLAQFIPESGRASIANFYHSLNFNAAFLSPLTAVSAGFTQPSFPPPPPPNIFPIRSCGQGLHCMANEIKLAAVALLMNTWQLQRSNAFTVYCLNDWKYRAINRLSQAWTYRMFNGTVNHSLIKDKEMTQGVINKMNEY